MKTSKIRAVGLVMFLVIVLSSFIAMDVLAAEVQLEMVPVQRVRMGKEVVKTADNFIVLFDASGSMQRSYKGTDMKKVDVAKKIFRERNVALPPLDWNAGLYLYTPWRTYYDAKPYNKEEFGNSLGKLATEKLSLRYENQPTPLGNAIKNLDSILAGLSGQTAIFIFSDGQFTLGRPKIWPIEAAREINEKHNVCFYLISSAETAKGKKLLQNIASVNPCSRVITFDALLNRPEYTIGAIYAVRDVAVMETEMVSKVVGVDLDSILFDFGKTDIRPEYYDELNALGKFLQDNPKLYVVIEGFTDRTGDVAYNMYLSRERAESVRDYLKDNFNIADDQLVVVWYGKAVPVTSGETAQERAQDRRVRMLIRGFE